MVHFVGAGPGAEDLITVRGSRLLEAADIIIYTGSLVNPKLLACAARGCAVYDSAGMTLDEVIDVMERARDKEIVRLHTGDPSLYGAVREQMDRLLELSITFAVCPGVSSLFGAASSLNVEYTLPDVTQTVIITRVSGRTAVPERESVRNLAVHGATMVFFLSAGFAEALSTELIAGGYSPDTPAAVVYKATWPDELIKRGTVGELPQMADGITKTALVMVGGFLGGDYSPSRLYAPDFATGYRKARADGI
jgi:precorrin-4/cobalt-precorrin-4 C11-methyltransferase